MASGADLIRRPDPWLELEPAAVAALQRFEETLDVDAPARGAHGARVIGHGEVTTVIAFDDPLLAGYAYKRMALFRTVEELRHVAELYLRYNGMLRARGICTPPCGHVVLRGFHGLPVLYLFQELIPPGSLATDIVRRVPEPDACRLLRRILALEWEVYRDHGREAVQLGIDGQLSNYAVLNMAQESETLPAEPDLTYLDTSTAMLRENGRDLLDIELFLRVMPAVLRAPVQWFFLRETINKYFSFRGIVLDLIANLYKEQLAHRVAAFISEANAFFAAHAPELQPLEVSEVQKYYREDAFVWELVSRLRNIEYFISTRLLRRTYPHIRPGPVRR